MMRLEDVREHLDTRPFEPFRICFSDGSVVEVKHPELCWLGRTSMHVAVLDPQKRGRALRVIHCALVHIVRFEPLNGEGRRTARRKNGRK